MEHLISIPNNRQEEITNRLDGIEYSVREHDQVSIYLVFKTESDFEKAMERI